jgi:uncharacterized cupredoxin-like copper-binding protein
VGRTRVLASAALALAGALGVGAIAIAVTTEREPLVVNITIHYSHFEPAASVVPAGRPVTFVIANTDPIDHEWIVGDAAVHARHRTGTEPVHGARSTEVSVGASTRQVTTVTCDARHAHVRLSPAGARGLRHDRDADRHRALIAPESERPAGGGRSQWAASVPPPGVSPRRARW